MKEDKPYVMHILDAIASINRFCKGKSKEEFLSDELLREGVVRKLEIVGEASKRLSKEFKGGVASAPWSRISGMRDKLIHGYAGVDFGIVWKVVKEDLPALEAALKKALEGK